MPLLSLLGNPILWVMEESNEQARVSPASHILLSPILCGPLNNSKKAKLLCVINPRWEQSASPPGKFTTTKHSGSPWQKGQRLTDQLLAWAVWWFLPSHVLQGRELQGAFTSVESCSVCSDTIPAPSLEGAQWSNRAAQLYPKCRKKKLWKRVIDSAESRQLTSSLKKAASLCCSE